MFVCKLASPFRAVSIALGLATMITVAAAQAPSGAPPTETVKQLKDNVYYASGSTGSNNGVILGNQGVVLIDTGITADSEKVELAEIARVTPKPISAAILTHSDGDHVNGLAVLPEGITIVSQENCKTEMEAAMNNPPANGRPVPKVPLPTKTVDKKDSMTLEGVKFEFLHVAPAHTSGDLVVYLPERKIVFTGDIISGNTPYPLIHLEKHGSSQGWIDTVTAILSLDADTFVPGHGDVHNKAEIEQRLSAVKERRAQIQSLVSQGRTLDEIKQQFGEAAAPAAAGRGPRFASFTEVVYQELTQKN